MRNNYISDFSNEGPLRDGALKPDIAAPGAMIIAPLSSDSVLGSTYRIGANYRVDAGTSMATPFISGLIALLLQRDPNLDPQAIKDMLYKNASIPRKKPGSFHPKWGYGLIDCAQL
jgi:subtilisin family serine protease